MFRHALLTASLLLLLPGLAGAHDVRFSAADHEGLKKFLAFAAECDETHDGRIPAVAIRGAAEMLKPLSGAAVLAIDHLPEWSSTDASTQSKVVRLIRGVKFARMAQGVRGSAEDLAALFCAEDARAPGELLLALARTVRSEPVEKLVVNLLGPSPRAELRVVGGRLAKILAVVARPSPGLLALCESLLVDPDPSVSAVFAFYDAADVRAVAVMDSLVSHAADVRLQRSVASGLLRGTEAPVGNAVRARLAGEWILLAEGKADRPAGDSAEELRTWWKAQRSKWPEGADSGWETIYEGKAELQIARPMAIKTSLPGRSLTIALTQYEEDWDLNRPVLSTRVVICDGEHEVVAATNEKHDVGFILDGRRGDDPKRYRLRALVLPQVDGFALVWAKLYRRRL